MSLGPPRGALTGPSSLDDLFDGPEPPPRRSRRGRRNSYTSRDRFSPQTRLAVLLRDGMTCTLCGCQLTLQPGLPNSAVAGHVLARWRGGAPTMENGRAECLRCSTRGGGMERVASGPPRPCRAPRATANQVPSVW